MHPLLIEALNFNQKIFDLAESEEWIQVETLATQRHQVLENYFKLSPLPDAKSIINDVAMEISSNDEKISLMMKQSKKSLIGESLNLRKGDQAAKQYQQTFNQHHSL